MYSINLKVSMELYRELELCQDMILTRSEADGSLALVPDDSSQALNTTNASSDASHVNQVVICDGGKNDVIMSADESVLSESGPSINNQVTRPLQEWSSSGTMIASARNRKTGRPIIPKEKIKYPRQCFKCFRYYAHKSSFSLHKRYCNGPKEIKSKKVMGSKKLRFKAYSNRVVSSDGGISNKHDSGFAVKDTPLQGSSSGATVFSTPDKKNVSRMLPKERVRYPRQCLKCFRYYQHKSSFSKHRKRCYALDAGWENEETTKESSFKEQYSNFNLGLSLDLNDSEDYDTSPNSSLFIYQSVEKKWVPFYSGKSTSPLKIV